MTTEDQLFLRARLREAQPELDDESMSVVIARVSDDARAAALALRWARLDALPTHPDVEGINPASLVATFKPSVALTALAQLLTDPAAVLETLRNPPPGWTRARATGS